MTDDGAREPAGVTRVVAVDRAGCARVVGRLHAAHNRSVLGLEQQNRPPVMTTLGVIAKGEYSSVRGGVYEGMGVCVCMTDLVV